MSGGLISLCVLHHDFPDISLRGEGRDKEDMLQAHTVRHNPIAKLDEAREALLWFVVNLRNSAEESASASCTWFQHLAGFL